MPKFLVEIIVAYPCVLEAKSIEEALEIAENTDWDEWPDDLAEIIEYRAGDISENEEEIAPTSNDNSAKSDNKAKLMLIKGGA